MLRRPPSQDGGRLFHQQKVLLALTILLLPWLSIVDAQQQRAADTVLPKQRRTGSSQPLSDDAVIHNWAATPIDAAMASRETANHLKKRASHTNLHQQHKQQATNRKTRNHEYDHVIIPDDASALATLAPAHAVRAPYPSRQQRSSSLTSGLATQQIARSLKDWVVEDFVLLATVDGDLYASDRKTGKERWHLEVEQAMVETKHHRSNQSVLDEDYDPVDHYIWAVEPNRDGRIYVWTPDSNHGLVWTGFTMKSLVEDVIPYEDALVAYTGHKKTTLITLDAATGRVLKWFGSSGSHVNEAESCLRPNALYDMDSEECSSTGTITLGRTEYTVGIQRKNGRPIATLKYSEWTSNNFDNDLYQQHVSSLDSWYITGKHDGRVYAFDYSRSQSPAPRFAETFSAPVARVFDVCRPWDASKDSNPDLIVLPQPPMPSQDESIARMRSNSIFLNQTASGSWYAMSGQAYPLIIDAPLAQITRAGGWDKDEPWENTSQEERFKALAGTHFLEMMPETGNQAVTLPAGRLPEMYDDLVDNTILPGDMVESDDKQTIMSKFKSLPQSAMQSVKEFVSNPILILLFVITIFVNRKQISIAVRNVWRGESLSQFQRYLPVKVVDEDVEENNADELNEEKDEEPDVGQSADLPASVEVEMEIAVKEVQDVNTGATVEEPSAKLSQEPTPVRESQAAELDKGIPVPPAAPSSAEPLIADPPEVPVAPATPAPKKKAHRGRRGGVKHRKGNRARDQTQSQSQGDNPMATVDETVEKVEDKIDHLVNDTKVQPDAENIRHDTAAITGSMIRMGNIEVNLDEQLGTGSNGTVVFAGKFDGREVAVKRLLIDFYDIASQETKLLRESDDHPNVVRYYSQQIQGGFLYIALERCAGSLADVIEKPQCFLDLANAGRRNRPDILYQITKGIDHLHNLRIVHRDLKPQNILVNMGKDGCPRMLVSDFGLCKKLEGGQSSFGATTGRAAGTSGWRAPELLLEDDGRDPVLLQDLSTQSGSANVLVQDGTASGNRRATRAIDIFSLGLVFFYVLTEGLHPFDSGGKFMREVNIRNMNYELKALDSLGSFGCEAKDLIASMLTHNPKNRPSTRMVMSHPFFWSPKKRLGFLCDVSDHFEKEPRDPPSPALAELEKCAPAVIRGDFLRIVGRDFADSLGKQRKYTGTRLLDLLRALRNKRNHYEDMPESLQKAVGPLPAGYLSFWTTKFPMLILVCWNVVHLMGWDESDRFRDYYQPAAP